jgi:hypothetical protein
VKVLYVNATVYDYLTALSLGGWETLAARASDCRALVRQHIIRAGFGEPPRAG